MASCRHEGMPERALASRQETEVEEHKSGTAVGRPHFILTHKPAAALLGARRRLSAAFSGVPLRRASGAGAPGPERDCGGRRVWNAASWRTANHRKSAL